MYNQEIFEKLEKEFGEKRMSVVTDIISTLYDIKYNATNDIPKKEEYDYERQWWNDKHKEVLTKIEVI